MEQADLDQLLNGAPNQRYRGKTLEVTLKHSYGIHDFMMVAALIYAAVTVKPGKILCSIDYMQLSGGIFRRWSAEVSAENWKEKAEKTPDFRYKEFGAGVLF